MLFGTYLQDPDTDMSRWEASPNMLASKHATCKGGHLVRMCRGSSIAVNESQQAQQTALLHAE